MESKEIALSKETKGKIRFHVLAVICIILFAIAISPKTMQNDTYYTVKIGEYITQNGISDLTTDPFSWHELPYTFPHWLYDLMMYQIYNAFDWDGIYFSTIAFAAVLGMSIYLLCNKLSKNEILSFIGTMLAMYCLKSYITARAQLVTFILFIWTIIFIEDFLRTGRKRYVIPLILIPILIANLHTAVWPFYFVLYLPYIAEYILSLQVINVDLILYVKRIFWIVLNKIHHSEKFENNIKVINEKLKENKRIRKEHFENPYKLKIERNKNGKWLIVIAIVCIFTGLLTPIGFSTPYTYLYKTMTGNTTSVINEHLPLTLINNKECVVFLIVTLFMLIFTDTKIRAKDMFFLVGLTALTFMTRRQFSMLVLIGMPILVALIGRLFENNVPDMKIKLMKVLTNFVGIAMILCIVFGISMHFYDQKKNDTYVDTTAYPVAAADWILENLDIENIRLFNEYNYGSYLLYRGIPVMIDSRCDLYTPEFNTETGNVEDGQDIFMEVQKVCSISVSYENVFTKYDITNIISYSNSKLTMLLKKDSNYKVLYNDGYFIIFERNL